MITHRLPWVRLHIPVLALGGLLLLAPVCAKARTLHVVALGDSLTEGEGLPRGQAFPDELERALKLKGWDVEVVNAGYGGQTAGDALIRYDRFVPEGTDGRCHVHAFYLSTPLRPQRSQGGKSSS